MFWEAIVRLCIQGDSGGKFNVLGGDSLLVYTG